MTDQLPPSDIEAEKSALGSILIEPECLDAVRDALDSAEDFHKPAHATIYHAMIEVIERGSPLDPVTLTGRLADMGTLGQVGGVEYVTHLIEYVPHAAAADHYASRVAEKALARRLIEQQEVALKALYTGTPPSKIIDSSINGMIEMRQSDQTHEAPVADWLDEALEDDRPRIHSGMRSLDDIVGGFELGTMTIVGARPSMGKAQPLDAKVLTEAGFVRMGDLEVGDRLASIDGRESKVTGIYPQGELKINRITFSDGRSTECCDQHLWRVMYRDWDAPMVVNTIRLKDMISKKRYRNRLWIETFSGEFGIDRMLPIDPWLLGFLIGDGCLTGGTIRFSTSCKATVERVRKSVGSLHKVARESKYDYRISTSEDRGSDGRFPTSPLMKQLRHLGIWGKRSHEKRIPKIYQDATREQRAALLTGLMDSDGWVEKSGSMFYGTTSEQLAKDVTDLVRSLGGYCKNSTREPFYTYKGERRKGRTFYRQSIQISRPRLYCKCPDKLARLPEFHNKYRRLNVVSIEDAGKAEAQCISVSHPSRLYVTDDYTVTHNTAFGICLAVNMAGSGKPLGFISAEMKGRRIARRLVCSHARVSTEEFEQDKHAGHVAESIGIIKDWPLHIDETSGMHVDKVCSRIRRWHREHGIQAAVIDYLQLLSHSKEDEYNGVTYISKRLKSLAQELDIALFVLAQLNRQNTMRQDKKPTMADLRGSGAVEQDADVILLLHRDGYYDPVEGNQDEAQILVEKSRDGRTGTATTGWIGKCGVFSSGLPEAIGI